MKKVRVILGALLVCSVLGASFAFTIQKDEFFLYYRPDISSPCDLSIEIFETTSTEPFGMAVSQELATFTLDEPTNPEDCNLTIYHLPE